MSRKLFTEEQIAALRQNPYVYSVSRSTLVLRKSFKEIFYTEYMEGVYPKDVFKNTALTLLCWAKDALAVLSSISKRNMPNMVVSMKAGDPPTGLTPPPRSSLKMILRPSDMKLNTCGRKWNI